MVLIKISPVILMVLIGFFCRKTEMITTEGMEGLKTLATSLMLPVLLFHTLATTEYTSATIAVIGIMLLALSAAFIIGMLIKRAVPSAGIFFPFLVTSFEGGMLGYPCMLFYAEKPGCLILLLWILPIPYLYLQYFWHFLPPL